MTTENEKLTFIGCSEKIDKVLSTEKKFVVSLNQLFVKAISVSSSMVSSKGTLVNREETS